MVVVAPTSMAFSLNHGDMLSFQLSVLGIAAADTPLLEGGFVLQFLSNGVVVCAPCIVLLPGRVLEMRVADTPNVKFMVKHPREYAEQLRSILERGVGV